MRLHTRGRGIPSLRLWLPLFLLWPIVLLALVLVSPFLLAGLLILSAMYRPGLDLAAIAVECYRLLCGLKGLEVDFEESRKNFLVRIRLQ